MKFNRVQMIGLAGMVAAGAAIAAQPLSAQTAAPAAPAIEAPAEVKTPTAKPSAETLTEPAATTPGATVPATTPAATTPAATTPAATTPAATTPAATTPATAAPEATATAAGTIVDVASSNETFKTLVSALTKAELTEVLAGEGPFTVFAPTDAAFAALPEGTVEKLLKPENREALIKVLTYHVLPGSVTSEQIAAGEVNTVEGSPVTIAVTDGKVTVEGATVTQADIMASNGVIHAIDKVILPPGM
jgi:uncharacterized surface protein with fasciclin (FAS1) repeats